MECGAHSITIHLREDRRHIKDLDVVKICKNKKIITNLEISLNDEILTMLLKLNLIIFVLFQKNRKEVTTEGGLNLSKNIKKIRKIISKFKKKKIRTSLFIDPNLKNIKIANKKLAKGLELHTGKISNLVKNNKIIFTNTIKLRNAVNLQKNMD